MKIQAAPPHHLPWLVERVGYAPTAGLRAIEAIAADGTIAGMVGFDNWGPNCVEMHFAVDRPIALRALALAGFDYAFREAGRTYIVGLTPASRNVILSWRGRVGFEEIHRLKDGYAPGDDLVYSVLHRDNCRWWRRKD